MHPYITNYWLILYRFGTISLAQPGGRGIHAQIWGDLYAEVKEPGSKGTFYRENNSLLSEVYFDSLIRYQIVLIFTERINAEINIELHDGFKRIQVDEKHSHFFQIRRRDSECKHVTRPIFA